MKITKNYLRNLIKEQLEEVVRVTEPDVVQKNDPSRVTSPDVGGNTGGSEKVFDISVKAASKKQIEDFIPKILAFAEHYKKNGVDYNKVMELTDYLKAEIQKAGNVPE